MEVGAPDPRTVALGGDWQRAKLDEVGRKGVRACQKLHRDLCLGGSL